MNIACLQLVADLQVGEGTIYHPGGIDYDGRYICVLVAECRPNSRSMGDASALYIYEAGIK